MLFLKRALFLRHYASTFCFPGGKCDGDESAVQGALRETREETGLPFDEDALIHLFEVDGTLPDGTPLKMTAFLVRVPSVVPVRLSEEHTEFLWLSPEDALRLLDLAGPFTRQVLESLRFSP